MAFGVKDADTFCQAGIDAGDFHEMKSFMFNVPCLCFNMLPAEY